MPIILLNLNLLRCMGFPLLVLVEEGTISSEGRKLDSVLIKYLLVSFLPPSFPFHFSLCF
ncbi:hypothetical protein I3843_15G152500 [Carya illinoinensis]|nr:hypothetical protein I3843_15G152500 [Carya illinoinensis]